MAEFTTYDKQAIDAIANELGQQTANNAAKAATLQSRLIVVENMLAAHIQDHDTGTPPPDPEPGTFPGDPGTKFYWGASIQGNGNPSRHETPSGQTLGIRRTFFGGWSERNQLIQMASSDINAGRLPWVSIKTPPWAEMAAGTYDQDITDLLDALSGIPSPVWLTPWHEPGNDPGNPADHLAMNRRFRNTITSQGISNVALAIVYIAGSFEKRNPEEWFADDVYDIIGVDVYKPDGGSLIDSRYLPEIEAFVQTHQKPYAFGEWGIKPGSNYAERVTEVFDYCAANPLMVGACYYDSDSGSRGPWTLEEPALSEFHRLLGDPRVARV